jgi:hypothetical protein
MINMGRCQAARDSKSDADYLWLQSDEGYATPKGFAGPADAGAKVNLNLTFHLDQFDITQSATVGRGQLSLSEGV